MNSGENIRNALHVMYKTYENIEKLMEYTKIVSEEKTDYRSSVDKFLRYKSDNYSSAWLINNFILLFQNNQDPDCESENGWKNAPIYVIEICLGDLELDEKDLPSINLSTFEYNDIDSWSEGCSPASHWVFYWLLRKEDYMDFKFEDKLNVEIGVPKNEKASKTYWGLKRVTTRRIDLTDITSENLKDIIFGTFDELANL